MGTDPGGQALSCKAPALFDASVKFFRKQEEGDSIFLWFQRFQENLEIQGSQPNLSRCFIPALRLPLIPHQGPAFGIGD